MIEVLSGGGDAGGTKMMKDEVNRVDFFLNPIMGSLGGLSFEENSNSIKQVSSDDDASPSCYGQQCVDNQGDLFQPQSIWRTSNFS